MQILWLRAEIIKQVTSSWSVFGLRNDLLSMFRQVSLLASYLLSPLPHSSPEVRQRLHTRP